MILVKEYSDAAWSLIDQKQAIGLQYVSENELPAPLTVNQWNLMEMMHIILDPFEEMTRQMSSSDASVSDVFPAVAVLPRLLLKQMDEDQGNRTMKSTLLAALQKRFTNMEKNPLYCISTLIQGSYYLIIYDKFNLLIIINTIKYI